MLDQAAAQRDDLQQVALLRRLRARRIRLLQRRAALRRAVMRL